ncbi:DUF1697 domain-containing protein [Frankia sp. RB7]|nr:DUF1697 domain-containing protein [Frankia sp. RB7]
MTIYVALLYSVVLPLGRRLAMAELRAMAQGLGLHDPQTIGATGNLTFESDEASASELEKNLEAAFNARFGKPVAIIVRNADSWRRLLRANPFRAEATADPERVAVRVMRSPIPKGGENALTRYISDERIAVAGGDLWIHFNGDPARSRLLSALGAGRLEGVGTLRNTNTLRRIGEAVTSAGSNLADRK